MPEPDGDEAKRKIWFVISVILIILGIVFYWAWALTFGTWNLISQEGLGAYVITVMLVGFGILGALLYRKKKQ